MEQSKEDIENIKNIMDVTKIELIKKMKKEKFRRKIFKTSKLYSKIEVEQCVSDWETLSEKSKMEWFDTVPFHSSSG